MSTFILAAEAATEFAGDDLQMIAWVLTGIVLLTAAITTAIVSPGPEHHDH